MRPDALFQALRALNWLVITLMLAAVAYGATMSIVYWSGIGV